MVTLCNNRHKIYKTIVCGNTREDSNNEKQRTARGKEKLTNKQEQTNKRTVHLFCGGCKVQ